MEVSYDSIIPIILVLHLRAYELTTKRVRGCQNKTASGNSLFCWCRLYCRTTVLVECTRVGRMVSMYYNTQYSSQAAVAYTPMTHNRVIPNQSDVVSGYVHYRTIALRYGSTVLHVPVPSALSCMLNTGICNK